MLRVNEQRGLTVHVDTMASDRRMRRRTRRMPTVSPGYPPGEIDETTAQDISMISPLPRPAFPLLPTAFSFFVYLFSTSELAQNPSIPMTPATRSAGGRTPA